jgi:NhaA family Na+:H+ antiporter
MVSGGMARTTEVTGGIRGMFARFVHSAVSSSLVLLACTLLALAWANSPWADAYFGLARTKIGLSWGEAKLVLSLQEWVNDLLMAVFFFVVGLEIKRELVVGQLSSVHQAVLPVAAAVGGMAAPAAFYLFFNAGGPGRHGWGVPMATDIAFALGVLSLFGRRVPVGLKVLLTALAIADDLGAVLVIALFYTGGIRPGALLLAAGLLSLIALASRLGVRQPGVYIALALGVWAAVLSSGVHATVAGILVSALVPVRPPRHPAEALAAVEEHFAALKARPLTPESMIGDRSQLDHVVDLHEAAGDLRPPGLTLEQELHPIVAFLVLPVFALFNAGVAIEGGLTTTLGRPVALGILGGLVLGKQIGVVLFAWLAVKTGRASMPEGVTWGHLYGAGCLAGIGFTMSLFVADLGFPDEGLVAQAKVAILAASLLAAAWGGLWLHVRLPRA